MEHPVIHLLSDVLCVCRAGNASLQAPEGLWSARTRPRGACPHGLSSGSASDVRIKRHRIVSGSYFRCVVLLRSLASLRLGSELFVAVVNSGFEF